MAYDPLLDTEIEVGKPVKKSLFTKIKGNELDHETRIDALEEGAGSISVADFEVVGYISHYAPSELRPICTFRAPAPFNLLEFVVTLLDSPNGLKGQGEWAESSTSGILELDLRKSTDGGATFATVLTTRPAILAGYNGAGLSSRDAGQQPVEIADVSLNQDDLLQVWVMSMKDTQGSFHVSCYGTLD